MTKLNFWNKLDFKENQEKTLEQNAVLVCRNMLRDFGTWTRQHFSHAEALSRELKSDTPGTCSVSFKTLHLSIMQCLTTRAYIVAFAFSTSLHHRYILSFIYIHTIHEYVYICLWNISCGIWDPHRIYVSVKWKKKQISTIMRAFYLRNHIPPVREHFSP